MSKIKSRNLSQTCLIAAFAIAACPIAACKVKPAVAPKVGVEGMAVRSFSLPPYDPAKPDNNKLRLGTCTFFLWPEQKTAEVVALAAKLPGELDQGTALQEKYSKAVDDFENNCTMDEDCSKTKEDLNTQFIAPLDDLFNQRRDAKAQLRAALKLESPLAQADTLKTKINTLDQQISVQKALLVAGVATAPDPFKDYLQSKALLTETLAVNTDKVDEFKSAVYLYAPEKTLGILQVLDTGELSIEIDFSPKPDDEGSKAIRFTTKKGTIRAVHYEELGGKLSFEAVEYPNSTNKPEGTPVEVFRFQLARVKYTDTDSTGRVFFGGKLFRDQGGVTREGVADLATKDLR